jgi:16S rRNA (uracil1498-N3)-methyltransferase
MPRFYCPAPLAAGTSMDLPAGAARHVQVLRMQPGGVITVFNGEGGEFDAVIERIGRRDVSVVLGQHHAIEREAARSVHLAVGIPANERMDWLVEKAVELGAASIQPLIAERSVLKLSGERAEKKRVHWQAIAIAACEQCGRNRVPPVHEARDLAHWLATLKQPRLRLLLSLGADAHSFSEPAREAVEVMVLSGPEGGLTGVEEQAALSHGFAPVSLGLRVLRADTAPLAALAALTLGT